MTTAARPTWAPARGGSGRNEGNLGSISKQYSNRDMPSHTKLKYRRTAESDDTEELRDRDDLRANLEEREHAHRKSSSSSKHAEHLPIESSSKASSRPRPLPTENVDADDPLDSDSDEDAADSDSDDDTAALMAELQRIKKDRAADQAKIDAEKAAESERIRTENLLTGNPLLRQDSVSSSRAASGPGTTNSTDFRVKRRWDDDVVFKNCARGRDDEEEKKRGRYVNDSLRSQFHKSFMSKYIK